MEHEKALVAVDPVIFVIANSQLKVLLKKREKEPFKDKYELPGGLLTTNETANETLLRKLKDIISDSSYFMQFSTFTEPKRDPRSRTISIGYIALLKEDQVKQGEWFNIENLPSLAFDHKNIMLQAHKYLKQNLNSQIVRHFLPQVFPLNSLQLVHEIIKKEKYDNRNFRKKMIASGIVEQTKISEQKVSHRPAKLYKFKD